jgi:hypothetical protein
VVTPLVYATDFVNENEETVPVVSVETEVADPVSDESSDGAADLVDSTDEVENEESEVSDETDFL